MSELIFLDTIIQIENIHFLTLYLSKANISLIITISSYNIAILIKNIVFFSFEPDYIILCRIPLQLPSIHYAGNLVILQ
jgi:hypothetical protein